MLAFPHFHFSIPMIINSVFDFLIFPSPQIVVNDQIQVTLQKLFINAHLSLSSSFSLDVSVDVVT